MAQPSVDEFLRCLEEGWAQDWCEDAVPVLPVQAEVDPPIPGEDPVGQNVTPDKKKSPLSIHDESSILRGCAAFTAKPFFVKD